MGLLFALMFVSAAVLACFYGATFRDGVTRSPLWKRRLPRVLLASPLLLWLFWFGAVWSVNDRVRGVKYPLPWPGEYARRFRHTDSTPATTDSGVYVRITPNWAYYARQIDDDSPLYFTVLRHPIGTGRIEWREWTKPFAERRVNQR